VALNVAAVYGTLTIPAAKVVGLVMIGPVVTVSVSITVIGSELTTSGKVSESITVMVSLSVTMAGYAEAARMVSEYPVTVTASPSVSVAVTENV
jgi:hypothetical protein